MVGILQFLLVTYQRGSGRAMVSVGDVHSRYLFEYLRDMADGNGVVYQPERVAEALRRCHKVILRLAGGNLCNDGIQVVAVGVSEEHRFHVGVVHPHMFHAVFLFVAAGQFVLLDAPLHIIIHPRGYHQSVLCPAVHRLGIHIVFLLLVLHQPALFPEEVEVLARTLIHFRVMLVGTVFEVDFRFDDVIQRFLVACRLSACFLRVQHIVGTTADLLY